MKLWIIAITIFLNATAATAATIAILHLRFDIPNSVSPLHRHTCGRVSLSAVQLDYGAQGASQIFNSARIMRNALNPRQHHHSLLPHSSYDHLNFQA
jgi:hypothetical protein